MKIISVKAFYPLLLAGVLFYAFSGARPAFAAAAGCPAEPPPMGTKLWDVVFRTIADPENAAGTGLSAVLGVAVNPLAQTMTHCQVDQLADYFIEGDQCACSPRVLAQGESLGSNQTPNGSLFAIAVSSTQLAMDTPPPVNLAQFFNSVKAESPFFRETYAASAVDYVPLILGSWRAVRNISYGLLAAFVMVIAIMVALRKKMDAQTVVTAQAAIPRIVISAVLIAFSYPLGSLMAMLVVPLTRVGMFIIGAYGGAGGALGIFEGDQLRVLGGLAGFISADKICPVTNVATGGDIGANFTNISTCSLEAFLRTSILGRAALEGTGAAVGSLFLDLGTVILFLATVGVWLVALFIALFSYIMSYLKILIYTIFSPFFFAAGAIPGQEHWWTDWFKNVLTAVLTLPAIMFLLVLGVVLSLSMAGTPNPIPGTSSVISASFTNFLSMAVMALTGIMAIKAPGMIDAALKGPKKK